MSRLWIDIETIPTQDAAERERIALAERDRNAALVKPHGEAKVAENIEEAIRKTSLDGAVGEIACVAVSTSHAPAKTWHRDYRDAGSERTMLADVLEHIIAHEGPVRLCGHNVVGFDMPFLRQRAFVHGLALPPCLMQPPKPWEAVLDDTMLMWSGGVPGKLISLDRLCRALGLPGKGELDGAGVWDAVRQGRIDEVVRYCAEDTQRAWRAHGKMIACFGAHAQRNVREHHVAPTPEEVAA